MIANLDHVAIAVEDLDAAVSCYTQLLGRAPSTQGRVATFALRNTRVVLAEGSAPEGVSALGLGVVDGVATALQLTAAGIAVAQIAGAVWQIEPAYTRNLPLQLVQRQGVSRGHEGARAHGNLGGHDDARGQGNLVGHDDAHARGLESALAAAQAELPAADSFSGDQVEALDHLVIRSALPEHAVALYGGALGIRLALDRELAGTRMLFFRTGGVTLEVIADASATAADSFYGLAYRVRDLDGTHARLTAAGFALTEPRAGRKPGTHVFSVRASTCGVPTLFIRDPNRD